jgi:ABC-type transport system involved in multi-copper enzyme maturation permease subunit
MRDQIRSELRKLRTTRSVYGFLAGIVALVTIGAVGTVHDTSVAALSGPLHDRVFLHPLPFVLPVFLLSLGIRSFTEEFRYGSIVPTLLASPDRRRVLLAKLAVMAGAAVVFVLAAEAVAIGVGTALAIAKGATITLAVAPLAGSIAELLAVSVLWIGIGVGVGLAIRHQVAAAVGALVWLFVGEQLVGALVPGVARYLPAHAANAVFAGDPALLAPLAGGLVLVAWTAAALLSGAVVMDRRDIA